MSEQILTRADARRQLLEFNASLATAYLLLKPFEALVDQFMREGRDMGSFGPFINPTLFMDPERRATEALLKPIYRSAAQFIKIYEAQRERAGVPLDQTEAAQ
jgi:hypothetical protein